MVGSSLVVHWFVFGSSLVFNPRGIGKVKEEGILRKVFFAQAQVVSPFLRRGDGSVVMVVARVASGKKVRIYENSRTSCGYFAYSRA